MKLRPFVILACVFISALQAWGANDTPPRLKVAVANRPPYCFKEGGSHWSGLSISLWEQIAAKLGLQYDYVMMPLGSIPDALRSGACDLSPLVALFPDKSGKITFTEPYLFCTAGLLTRQKSLSSDLSQLFHNMFSGQTLLLLGVMFAGMLLFSLVLLLFERQRRDGSHFSGSTWTGLGSALWFAAATMTTVGYGDKTPTTAMGRILTFFWMLFGVLVIAIFTGSFASALTVTSLNAGSLGVDDLARYQIGVINGSRYDQVLDEWGIPNRSYFMLRDGLNAVKEGKEIDSFLTDSVTLQYEISHHYQNAFRLHIIPSLETYYAFATRKNLAQYEDINREFLKITLSPDWYSQKAHWIEGNSN